MARTNGTFIVHKKSSLQAQGEYSLPVTNMDIGEISPDGKHLACWCADGKIPIFEIPGLKQVAQFEPNARGQRVLAFSPNGKVLAGWAGSTMWAWSLEPKKEILRDEKNPSGAVLAMAFSPDSKWVAFSQFITSTAVI